MISLSTTGNFVKAIHEVSVGQLSEESRSLLLELDRPLAEDATPIRIFAENFDVDVCNSANFLELPGMPA